ncbi:glycosyltransferase [uncultured Cocleimonas sp.]|uniref:glycosyltransferase n=1 Tax=uncultured Cocleimonas sp. TaxID=1051587 RepID=UPI00263A284D|nr:glycosyltransferase [uncultured Cocleimonas sp.]
MKWLSFTGRKNEFHFFFNFFLLVLLMRECVVVLGMHRSGTSVLTGLISFFGGYIGSDVMSPTEDNPKGYFENNKVYQLNEKILKECGASWDDYTFDVGSIDAASFEKYLLDAKTVIEDELKYVNKLVIKDPRICVLFPLWERALDELNIDIKLVLAYRSPVEVSHSLLKRDGIDIEKGLMIWSHYFLQSELYSRKYQRMLVEYDADFKDMPSFVEKLGEFLDQKPTDEILEQSTDFYSYKLKHHKVSFENISDDLPMYLNSLNKLLASKKLEDFKTLDMIRSDFFRSKKYFRFDDRQRVLEKEELRDSELKFLKLEEAYHSLRERQLKEHDLLMRAQEELDVEKKAAYKAKNDLVKTKNDLAKAKDDLAQAKIDLVKVNDEIVKKDRELDALAIRTKASLDKAKHQLELMKSYYVSADNLLKHLLDHPSNYKKLYKQSIDSTSLKLGKALLPFAKNKRLTRDKILIMDSGLFSPFFYLTVNPDVLHAKADPLKHFCTKGWREGRSPSVEFDVKAYLRKHPDVERAKINPLIHYIQSGKNERREISPVLYCGESFVSSNRKTTNNSVGLLTKPENIVGPIIDQGWENSIDVISSLKSLGKAANKNIPSKIIEDAIKQVEENPLTISVIMPTWNREKSICKAIDSIFKQSYLPHEIIISDDGSTDETIKLLNDKYPDQIASGVVIILKNKHQGVSASRNEGLAKASSDLIAYLDSDNIWREHYLLLMTASFSQNDELNCAYAELEKHDANNNNKKKILAVEYDRKRLLDSNFIDLNIFIHRKQLFDQFGGFDTQLKRLVDWDLIIRYTKNYTPALIPFVGVDYFLDDKNLKNITTTVSLDDNRERVYQGHFQERVRYGLEPLRIAYVIWDFPALSQTFVLNELRWLIKNGYDTKVYYSKVADKAAVLDFEIDSYQVEDENQLAKLLKEHERNICHSQFVYPAVTLLTYPAAIIANIPFTFMPHAVDLFHHSNKERNKIAEIVRHQLCLKVYVYGEFHKSFLIDQGVPANKIGFNFQAVDFEDFKSSKIVKKSDNNELRGLIIARFIEKKGITYLIDAAAKLENQKISFDLYGFGPLQDDYEEKINKQNVSNFNLKGVINNQAELSEAYGTYDFLMVPSVVAENGDMDGFPTVILEAMAAGLPVITTDVSAIPDYLTNDVEAIVVDSANVDALVDGVKKLKSMSAAKKRAMVSRSQAFLAKMVGVNKSMGVMRDTWQNYSIDIFLVTYNTVDYEDRNETFEIIRRVFAMTSTPFVLTIVDNGSDEDFLVQLRDLLKGYENVRLILKRENLYCGPASNLALKMATSEFAIYICSKEGFIKSHAWERSLIDFMRKNPDVPIGGHLSHMPSYVYGDEYQSHPLFEKFRNKDFAANNPGKPFGHIQGGVYILNRTFFQKHGGFSDHITHNGMDVELSYYVESLGYQLGEIPEVASLTVKTRPTLTSVLSERTVIAHPLTIEKASNDLDTLLKNSGQRCNLCNWRGDSFDIDGHQPDSIKCPSCQSTSFGRVIYRIISNDHHLHRKEVCSALTTDNSLVEKLSKFFDLKLTADVESKFSQTICPYTDVFILDSKMIDKNTFGELMEKLLENLAPSGAIFFTEIAAGLSASPGTNSWEDKIKNSDKIYEVEYIDHSSYCIAYDWRRVVSIKHKLV